jgi:hypothetical protein
MLDGDLEGAIGLDGYTSPHASRTADLKRPRNGIYAGGQAASRVCKSVAMLQVATVNLYA